MHALRRKEAAVRVAAASLALLWLAATPLHSDTSLSYWYESLTRNGGGGSCCGAADCHAVDYRTGPHGYEAFVDGQWIAVPDGIILRRHDNPTGGAVLCIDPVFRAMLCFVPDTQM
jgi:hypothetical protein